MKTVQQLYRSVVAATLLATLLLTGISCSSPTTTSPVNETLVSMKSNRFAPSTITITRGETITWVNDDTQVHTATSDMTEGGWNTGDVAPAAARSITFHSPGSYPYHCSYHASMGMRGTIIVK